jgi:hypothetical protein
MAAVVSPLTLENVQERVLTVWELTKGAIHLLNEFQTGSRPVTEMPALVATLKKATVNLDELATALGAAARSSATITFPGDIRRD